ncbi:MAG: ABC transporter ATP-binding protein [Spirochaetota bacterium]
MSSSAPAPARTATDLVLDVKNLSTHFHTDDGTVHAVDHVSFAIERGKTLGVVGESGCGKSVTAFSVLRLIHRTGGTIETGEIWYTDKSGERIDIASLDRKDKRLARLRGNEIAMIFQEPMTSLNPVIRIGEQIAETIRRHQGLNKEQAKQRTIELLKRVRIADAEQRYDEYPHQLSGGMRQRVVIAIGLSCNPNLLIADEPTTALDVTIEAQILKLLKELQRDIGMSVMIITHDMGVIGEMADDVIVVYAGHVVERATQAQIFAEPKHPYTQGLLQSIPEIGRKKRLNSIPGTVPNMLHPPRACRFADRCPHVMEICREQEPPDFRIADGHLAKCWLYEEKQAVDAAAEPLRGTNHD